LTPPSLVIKLGIFDLDPCSPINAPFLHAKTNFTTLDNGLAKKWFGRVYLNPPYGRGMELWLEKLKFHGNGIALIFARTETKCFLNTFGMMLMLFFLLKEELDFITFLEFKVERLVHLVFLLHTVKKMH
jgi:hypothetical protein